MTKEQRDQIEQRLLKERQRAVKAVRQLEETISPQDEDGDLTNYPFHLADEGTDTMEHEQADRKSTRLNSSHSQISYAVFCLKKKKKKEIKPKNNTQIP